MKTKTLSFCLLTFLKIRMLNSTPRANFKMIRPERQDENIRIARWPMWNGCRSLFSLLGRVSAAVLSLVNGKVDEVNEAALHRFGKWGQAGRGLMGHRQSEDKDGTRRTLSSWVFSWISLSLHSNFLQRSNSPLPLYPNVVRSFTVSHHFWHSCAQPLLCTNWHTN